MSQNIQQQKVISPQLTRIRHRTRFDTTNPRFASRQPGMANFLVNEATRANLTPLRLASLVIAVGGTGYTVGDKFTVIGGTGTITAIGMVTAAADGVVTAISFLDSGEYTVAPGLAAATAAFHTKNGATAGTGLTVDADVLTGAVAGVTDAELLDGLKGDLNVAADQPIITRARHYRDERNTDQTYLDNGVPVA